MLKVPEENIEGDVDASVTNVAEIVSSDAANVHPDLAFDLGLEQLFLPAHRVVQPKVLRAGSGISIVF